LRAGAIADFAVETGAIPGKVRVAVTGRVDVGLTTLGLGDFFADLMASFMALAPVRSANRAMALSERWSERLKIATYACLANNAGEYTGRWGEKAAIRSPGSGIGKYLTWPALHLFDGAHTDQSGVYQIGVGLQEHHIALPGSRYWRPSGYAAFPSQTSLAPMSAMRIHKGELKGYFFWNSAVTSMENMLSGSVRYRTVPWHRPAQCRTAS
jgi:hypothetical protein